MLSALTGCEYVADVTVDVSEKLNCLKWQQSNRNFPGIHGMLGVPGWFDISSIERQVVQHYPSLDPSSALLSLVTPGQRLKEHADGEGKGKPRVHVPLLTNPEAYFITGGKEYNMEVGKMYEVNLHALHSVDNRGTTDRIHLFFDMTS